MKAFINLEQVLHKVEAIPPVPVIAQKLLALELNTDKGDAQLLTLIGLDPVISARIVGLANSSLLGSAIQVTSIKDAVMRLGLNRVKSVALSIAMMSILTKHPESQIKANDLWLHSLGIAFSMSAVAKYMPENSRPPDDQIFLAGLLHDIGYMVISYLDVKASDALYAGFQTQADRAIVEIEQELIGMTHCEIGALVGNHWGLPKEIIATIRHHHSPVKGGSSDSQPLVGLASIAEKIHPEFCGVKSKGNTVSNQEWTELGIALEKVADIRNHVADAAAQSSEYASSLKG